ncbi:AcrR family transcriptional regulator [Pseudarthrobacter defluvii]|uniref:AcrR family transcriptional regulator n=1 Tax=Pseudarthrobacter defluvii TaxID=410837 RepID=A0ABT9UMX1_9MICC|nr:TetR/AcrR family transcriptional regulator [Pseudarthrobacter defluvii]MDQ0120995.1 AcrR family transcriptional regulator [Pseudarthrobacter defluvii]
MIGEAARLIDQRGIDGLSLAVLAEQLGVRGPSLYKHVDGVDALRRGVMLAAKRALGDAMAHAAVGRSGADAIKAVCLAYRAWALDHPGQYPLSMRAPAPDDEEDAAVSAQLVGIAYRVLAGYGLEGDDAVDATRFFRSALHGYVALETSGGFALPVDLDRSFQRLVGSVVTAISTWPVQHREPAARPSEIPGNAPAGRISNNPRE